MKKLGLSVAALFAAVFGGTAFAGATEGPPGSVVVPADQAAAILSQMGIKVPAQSCLAEPTRPRCPKVDRVVITPSASDANPTVYGPAAKGGFSQKLGQRRRLETAQVSYACAVNASDLRLRRCQDDREELLHLRRRRHRYGALDGHHALQRIRRPVVLAQRVLHVQSRIGDDLVHDVVQLLSPEHAAVVSWQCTGIRRR